MGASQGLKDDSFSLVVIGDRLDLCKVLGQCGPLGAAIWGKRSMFVTRRKNLGVALAS